jgi:hypothetical protein
MYSVHGWATIWPTYKNDCAVDDLQGHMDELCDKIANQIQHLGVDRNQYWRSPFAEIHRLNSEVHLWVAGKNNHARWRGPTLHLFGHITRVAPGSHGLVRHEDDEDPEFPNQCRVWVPACGEFIEHAVPILSPHFPP